MYYEGWQQRPMFTNAPEGHPAAAIMIINDPIKDLMKFRLVKAGYMVRTRADADTEKLETMIQEEKSQLLKVGLRQ